MFHKRIYIDTETTSTDHTTGGMIQWTAVVTINGVKKDSIDIKMQPYQTDTIEDGALEVNHITREELFSDDRLLPHAAYKEIIAFLSKHVSKFDRKDKFHWIGYNGKFDADFTRSFFEKNGDTFFGSFFWYPILDIAILAGFLLQKKRTEFKDFKERTVWEYLHQERTLMYDESMWHDALFDIERMMEIEEKLREIVFPKQTT
jgi:DNA polymerase-3 subunit epsilon